MAGAATAAPIDAAGALHWNPASISGLESSEVSFGLGLTLPTSSVSSRVAASPFGPLSGVDESEPGVSPVPHIAFVELLEGTALSYGIGVSAVGGFRINYPGSTSDPVLTRPVTAS